MRGVDFSVTVPNKARVQVDVRGLQLDTNRAAGNAVRLAMLNNFQAKGGRRYYGQAAKATEARGLSADGVQVEVGQRGIALHYYGGTVKPTGQPSDVTGKPTKALLIPGKRSPQRVRGVSLAELGIPEERIHLIRSKNGKAYLVADTAKKVKLAKKGTTRRKGKKKDEFIFLGSLRKSATIQPDPSVLPSAENLKEATLDAARQTVAASKWFTK